MNLELPVTDLQPTTSESEHSTLCVVLTLVLRNGNDRRGFDDGSGFLARNMRATIF